MNIKALVVLANSIVLEEQYEERENGDELYSYGMIALGYLTITEFELKKLIKRKINIQNNKHIMLKDCIEYLKKYDFGMLSENYSIDSLEFIRKMRNNSAHGEIITKEDFEKIKNILMDRQILYFISFELRE